MTVEVLENGAERFITAGGMTVTRQRHDTAYPGAIETYIDGLEPAAARSFPPTTNIPAAIRAGTRPSSTRLWSSALAAAP